MPAGSDSARHLPKLFDPEPAESDAESFASSEGATEPAVFNFGWHTMHSAARARFSREAASTGRPRKETRHYDMTRRAARAAYVRKEGEFKKNGMSSTRISQVFARATCSCILDGH